MPTREEATDHQMTSELEDQRTRSRRSPESVRPQTTTTTTRTSIERSLSVSTTSILPNIPESTPDTPADVTILRKLSAQFLDAFQRSAIEEAMEHYQELMELDVETADNVLSLAQEVQRLMFRRNSTNEQPLKRTHQDHQTSLSSDESDQRARKRSRLMSDDLVRGNDMSSFDSEPHFSEDSLPPSATATGSGAPSEASLATRDHRSDGAAVTEGAAASRNHHPDSATVSFESATSNKNFAVSDADLTEPAKHGTKIFRRPATKSDVPSYPWGSRWEFLCDLCPKSRNDEGSFRQHMNDECRKRDKHLSGFCIVDMDEDTWEWIGRPHIDSDQEIRGAMKFTNRDSKTGRKPPNRHDAIRKIGNGADVKIKENDPWLEGWISPDESSAVIPGPSTISRDGRGGESNARIPTNAQPSTQAQIYTPANMVPDRQQQLVKQQKVRPAPARTVRDTGTIAQGDHAGMPSISTASPTPESSRQQSNNSHSSTSPVAQQMIDNPPTETSAPRQQPRPQQQMVRPPPEGGVRDTGNNTRSDRSTSLPPGNSRQHFGPPRDQQQSRRQPVNSRPDSANMSRNGNIAPRTRPRHPARGYPRTGLDRLFLPRDRSSSQASQANVERNMTQVEPRPTVPDTFNDGPRRRRAATDTSQDEGRQAGAGSRVVAQRAVYGRW
jgi:hypothetical protein